MPKIYFTADSRYGVDRKHVKAYLNKNWIERGLPEGTLNISFVGSRKAKQLAAQYLHDHEEHPVLTFPYLSRVRQFPHESSALLGEIVISYPQVSLYAAQQDQEINKVIAHFIDHALSVMVNEMRTKKS